MNKIQIVFILNLIISQCFSDHKDDWSDHLDDVFGNSDLLKKGYVRIYKFPFDYVANIQESENNETDHDHDHDHDDHHDNDNSGYVSLYALSSELGEGKTPKTLVYEVESKNQGTFPADNSESPVQEMGEGVKTFEVKGAKNMFTVVKTGTGVYSSYYEMKQSDCLKMFIFPSSSGIVPPTRIEEKLIYLDVPQEKVESPSLAKHGHDDSNKSDYHDGKKGDGRRGKDDFDEDNLNEILPLNGEIMDSSIPQFIMFYCPFWKSDSAHSFTFNLNLKMMSDLPYYFGKSNFFLELFS